MNAILENARQHFARMAKQSFDVPEWGDDTGPARIYFDPLSLAARQRIENRAKGNASARLALVVILHAKDADGKPIFPDDAATRRAFDAEIDPAVTARIAARIMDVTDESDLGE